MDRIPDDASMENPPQPPLAGLDPADLLKQGAADDTFPGEPVPAFTLPPIEELALIFPQFEILELIGQGGMGAVYKVRQKELDRIVALKILPPSIGETPGFAERFTREARALAKLNHPGIVTLHEFGQREGLYFILMEFVDGVNLAQLMKSGRIAPREALAIVPQICDALQFAHDRGIVHRDIKPENLLLDRLGRVKVADFGIAKIVARAGDEFGAVIGSGSIPVPTDQTLAGKVLGTPHYIAPEQISHPAEVDHRADIYALGVVFYQMLTGELPERDLQAPSRKVSIDVRLDEMVLRALEKEPEKRYQTAHEFRTVLDEMPAAARPQAAAIPKRGMMARWWWIFPVMIPLGPVAGFALAWAFNQVVPKKYEAQAVLEVVASKGGVMTPQLFGTQFESIKSQANLSAVAKSLELPRKWGVSEDQVIRFLKGIVSAENIRGTDLITIRMRHPDERDAVEVTNAIARASERNPERKMIVHELAVETGVPVSPNLNATLALGSVAGLLVSPLMALLLIPLLHRIFADKNAGKASLGGWGWKVALTVVVFLMVSAFGIASLAAVYWSLGKKTSGVTRVAASPETTESLAGSEGPPHVLSLERGSPFGGVDLDTGIFNVYQPTGGIDDPSGAIRWREENGIDLVLDQKSAVPGVLLSGVTTSQLGSSWWFDMPEAQIVEGSLPPPEPSGQSNEPMVFLAASGPTSGTRTRAFRTAAGSVGILHLEQTGSATGVQVQWRILKNGEPDAGEMKAEESSPQNRFEIRMEPREGENEGGVQILRTGEIYHFAKTAVICDEHLKTASMGNDGDRYWLDVTLNEDGGKRLANAVVGRTGTVRLLMMVDGKILSAPVMNGPLTEQFRISGFKNRDEALDLLKALPGADLESAAPEALLDIFANGEVALAGDVISLPVLAGELEKLLRESKNAKVIIRGSADVPYQRIVEVIESCQKTGVWNLSFATADRRRNAAPEKVLIAPKTDDGQATEDAAKRFVELLGEISELKASGIAEDHPSLQTARRSLASFREHHPVMPDEARLKRVIEAKRLLVEAVAELDISGMGDQHPAVVSLRKQLQFFEEILAKERKREPTGAKDEGKSPAANAKSGAGEVERWLQTMDEGKYGDCYTALAKAASSQVTVPQWEAAMGMARGVLGALESRKFLASEVMKKVPGLAGVERMVYQFSSEFEKKKQAVETVILIKEGGEWKPAGYYIK